MGIFQGIAGDTQGNVYVSDNNRHQVLKRSSSGTVTVIAGTGLAGYNGDNIQATSAALYNPTGLAMDLSGNLFIADSFNHRIRRVDPNGIITTVAGNGSSGPFYVAGMQATTAVLGPLVTSLAVDGTGLYFADFNANLVVHVDSSGVVSFAMGPSVAGNSISPVATALDSMGNLFAGTNAGILEKKSGTISTFSSFTLSAYYSIAVDPVRGVCYTDSNQVKCVNSMQQTTVVAGNGFPGLGGDGGPATLAVLNTPAAITFDATG